MPGESTVTDAENTIKYYYYSNHLALTREGDVIILEFRNEPGPIFRLHLTPEQCRELETGFHFASVGQVALASYDIKKIIERPAAKAVAAVPSELPPQPGRPGRPKKKPAPSAKAAVKRVPKKPSDRRR